MREYAAKNPHNGKIIEVPGKTLVNALKLVALIPETKVMTRTVTEWEEWPDESQAVEFCPHPTANFCDCPPGTPDAEDGFDPKHSPIRNRS